MEPKDPDWAAMLGEYIRRIQEMPEDEPYKFIDGPLFPTDDELTGFGMFANMDDFLDGIDNMCEIHDRELEEFITGRQDNVIHVDFKNGREK